MWLGGNALKLSDWLGGNREMVGEEATLVHFILNQCKKMIFVKCRIMIFEILLTYIYFIRNLGLK